MLKSIDCLGKADSNQLTEKLRWILNQMTSTSHLNTPLSEFMKTNTDNRNNVGQHLFGVNSDSL